jgi:uncharacterized protein YlzI (FlbEa/FlbD family)
MYVVMGRLISHRVQTFHLEGLVEMAQVTTQTVITLVVERAFVVMERLIHHHVMTSHHVEMARVITQLVMTLVVGLMYVVTGRLTTLHVITSLLVLGLAEMELSTSRPVMT